MTSSPVVPPPLSSELVGRFMGALWRVARSFRHDFAPLLASRFDLDPPRFNVLQSIRGGHSYPKALAAHLHLPPTLLSRYLDQLGKQGLIERQIDALDSRRVRLSLTPEGEVLTSEVIRMFLELAAERLTSVDSARLGDLTTLLEQLDTLSPTSAGAAQPVSSPSAQDSE